MAFSRKSQLSISDLTVLRHPCTGGATTALPAPTTVLHDRPLRPARPSPPSCPTAPSVMPDRPPPSCPNGPLRHARPDRASRVVCRTRLQKNRPTWPPTCKRGTLLAENRHSPLRVYTQKHPKRRFRVNAARPVRPDLMPPSCPTVPYRHARPTTTVMPDLPPPSCPT